METLAETSQQENRDTTSQEGGVSELIPARVRAWIYALYAIGSVVLGAVQVGFSAAETANPLWLTVTLAVWVFLGGSQGLLALLKTPRTQS